MKLIALKNEDIKEFKKLMQEAFQYGYESLYGKSEEQILPEKDIDNNLNNENSYAYEMIDNNEIVGGVIVTIDEKTNHNRLDFLFVKIGVQSKGIGQTIWKQIEKIYPDTKIWETCTPYFDKRNIHFYVNRLGFHIVEYFNEKHPDPNMQVDCYKEDDGMFRFEKIMKQQFAYKIKNFDDESTYVYKKSDLFIQAYEEVNEGIYSKIVITY